MEIYTDLTRGKYYRIDSGSYSPSNRYGAPLSKFIPYGSGYSHAISGLPLPADSIYSVQPNKFDGYGQFPRPRVNSSLEVPFVDSFIRKKIKMPGDVSKFPKPLKHLSLSAVYDKSVTPIKFKSKQGLSRIKVENSGQSIEDLKKSLKKHHDTEIKTVIDMQNRLKNDRLKFKPYSPINIKEERRKLKGYFMKDFVTSGELFMKEKAVVQLTNSQYFAKLKHDENNDRKFLEKRRERLHRVSK